MTPRIAMGLIGLTLTVAGVGALSKLGGPEVELVKVEVRPDGRKVVEVDGVRVSADDVKAEAKAVDLRTIALPTLVTSKLGARPDGSLVAYVEIDGGMVVLDKFPCVRRRKGGARGSCPMRTLAAPVLGEDFGELNRFPVSMAGAVALDCEPVACSVWLGDEAEAGK